MTDITRKNLIERWRKIAESDLGTWITEPAEAIVEFFEDITEAKGFGNDNFRYTNIDPDGTMAAILRGFEANTRR